MHPEGGPSGLGRSLIWSLLECGSMLQFAPSRSPPYVRRSSVVASINSFITLQRKWNRQLGRPNVGSETDWLLGNRCSYPSEQRGHGRATVLHLLPLTQGTSGTFEGARLAMVLATVWARIHRGTSTITSHRRPSAGGPKYLITTRTVSTSPGRANRSSVQSP